MTCDTAQCSFQLRSTASLRPTPPTISPTAPDALPSRQPLKRSGAKSGSSPSSNRWTWSHRSPTPSPRPGADRRRGWGRGGLLRHRGCAPGNRCMAPGSPRSNGTGRRDRAAGAGGSSHRRCSRCHLDGGGERLAPRGPGTPVYRFAPGSRPPQSIWLVLEDTTDYPAPQWNPRSLEVVVDDDVAWQRGPVRCPIESQPDCGSTVSVSAVTGRGPVPR